MAFLSPCRHNREAKFQVKLPAQLSQVNHLMLDNQRVILRAHVGRERERITLTSECIGCSWRRRTLPTILDAGLEGDSSFIRSRFRMIIKTSSFLSMTSP